METRPSDACQHYFRTPDATIYGPVDMATLCLWAADARVIPGCELSADRSNWFPVESLPELRLNWSVHFDDHTTYGPLNLLAIWTLAAEKSIPRGVKLVETGSPRTAVLDDSLLPLLVDECRKVLAGCGNTLTDAIGRLAAAHKAVMAQLADRDASLEVLHAKLEQAELDLASHAKVLSETQRRLGAVNDSASLAATLERDTATLRDNLAAARTALAERDAQLTAMSLKLGATEGDLAVNLKLVSETQRRMAETLESGREQALKDAEALAQMKSELDTLSRSLQEARVELQERDARMQQQEASLVQLKSEGEAQAAQWLSRWELSQQLLAVEVERSRQEGETAAQLKTEVETLTLRLREVEGERQEKDNLARKQESTLAALKAEGEKLASQLRTKNTVLEKDSLTSRQREEALAKQLSQAKEALAKAQKAGRQAEQKLKDEMASVQRDLNVLMMASRCVKQVVGEEKVKPAAIDWVGEGKGVQAAPQRKDDVEAQFARLTLNEKFVVLQKELHTSAEEKEVMRRDLENIRGRHAFLQSESSRKEKESAEKLAQIQKEIKTSSEMLARTMEELERREGLLREMRKKTGAGGGAAGGPAVLDAEVIHSEVLGPEEGGEHGAVTEEPVAAKSGPEVADLPRGHAVLNNVEAQLQRELKKWETLKRENENKGGTLGKWFRRK